MRLVFFIPDLRGGGAERAVVNLLKHWHETTARDHLPTLIVRRLEGPYVSELPAAIRVRDLRISGGGLRASFLTALRLARLLRTDRPDSVVTFLSHPSVVLAIALSRHSVRLISSVQTPVRAYLADVKVNQPDRRFFRKLMMLSRKAVERRTSLYLPLSNGMAAELIEEFEVPPNKVMVLPNSLEVSIVSSRAIEEVAMPPTNAGAFIIATVARLGYEKGLDVFLHAVALLASRGHAVHWIVIGEGKDRRGLEELAAELAIDDRVSFVGFQNNPWALVAKSQLFVLPSRYEGFGNVLLEAMACGTPVLSTDAPYGPRDLIEHGVNGILTPVEDPMALANAVELLIEQPELRERMKERALESVQQYDAARIAQRFATIVTTTGAKVTQGSRS